MLFNFLMDMNRISFVRKAGASVLMCCVALGVSAQTPVVTGGSSAGAAAAARAAVARPTTSSGLGAATPSGPGLSLTPSGGIQNLGAGGPSNAAGQDKRVVDAKKLLPTTLIQGLQPNQFQIFVYENTGKLLPLFGFDLFNNPQAFSIDSAELPPPDHLLGPGDEVSIQLWGPVEYTGSHVLDRTGQITLPRVGTFSLQGVAVKDLESALRRQVSKVYVSGVTVTASMGKARGATVYVVGQAKQPGTYNVSSLSTMLNVLFASGGPSVTGSMRDIRLVRRGQVVTRLDLYDLIARGDKSRDMTVQSGDVLMIPATGSRMALVGASDHEAIYELKPNETIGQVLNMGSQAQALVSTAKALLERVEAQQDLSPRKVYDVVLDDKGRSMALRDGDILTLFPISPAFGNAITLQGTVAQQLRHPFTPGMRVSDVIPERDALISADYYKRKNMLVQNVEGGGAVGEFASRVAYRARAGADEVNWEYAVVERFNKTTMRPELLPFNLGRAVIHRDPAHNLVLEAGDVITILSAADIQRPTIHKPRIVRLEGEVQVPGIYQFEPGETLRQVINRASGLTPQAYVFGAEFVRDSVRTQQQSNLDTLIRRLESQQRNVSEKAAANAGERADQVRAQLEQQKDNLQQQIERLRELRSKGRVALELDPDKALNASDKLALMPDLPLEDGDMLVVPSQPGFVAVMGHVNNENSYLFRPDMTVGDVLDRAGPIEGADLSEIFVMRADGSALNKRSVKGWGGLESTRLMPGDTVVVPSKADRESTYSFVVRSLKDWSQILLNFGLGAAAYKSLTN